MTQPPLHTDPQAQIEAARRVLLADPVPWDELRERRVLGRIEHALDDSTAAAPPPRRPSLWVATVSIAGVLAAAAIALWFFFPIGALVPEAQPLALDEPPEALVRDSAGPEIPFVAPTVIALADGSVAELRNGARVEVDEQTEQRVRLQQRAGTVRYEVAKNPERRFVVEASGVVVRVVGTIFTVSYAGDSHVEVGVERGLVEVVTSDRVAQLGAGDSLRIELEPEDFLIIDDDDEPSMLADSHAATRTDKPRRPRPQPTATPNAPTPNEDGPDLETLLDESDAARAAGDLGRAAKALSEATRRFSGAPQTVSAYFQLGRVQRRRGLHGAAAKAFAACLRRSPRGSLAEDARAESAQSWADAGQSDKASVAARGYVDRYPAGAHADRMRRILDRP